MYIGITQPKNALQFALFSLMMTMLNTTHASTEQDEINQLRAEVQELRALLEQRLGATSPISPPPQMAIAQTTAPTQASASTASPLADTAFKAYGFIRLDGIYDIEASPGEFIDMSTQPFEGNSDKLQMSAATSRVGVDMIKSTPMGDITAKVEGDFWGRNATSRGNFRLRHAYASVGNWLVGQTASPFASGDIVPDLIDFNAIVSGSYRRAAQLRYTAPLSATDKIQIAIEDPTANGHFPDISAKYEHMLANGLINARAVMTQVRDDAANDHALGYGLALGAKYALTPKFSLNGNLIYLDGANKYSDTGSSVSELDSEQDIQLNEMIGAFLGATYTFSPQWRSTLAYGWSQFDDSNAFATIDPTSKTINKELQQATINLIYTPLKSLSFGGEYSWGEREVLRGDIAKLSRLNFMARYAF